MTTAPHSRLLILILALLNGSPSMAKSSERSGLRKLQQEHYEGIEKDGYNDGDVAFYHGGSKNKNRRDQRDALYLFAEVAWQERVANDVFDALDKDSDGTLGFCDMREMFFDGRDDLLVKYLNQRSLQTGGVGFTDDDFVLFTPLPGSACGNSALPGPGGPFIIPVNNQEIFPQGLLRNGFPKAGWWGFMQEGLRVRNPGTNQLEPIDSDGFLDSYSNQEWRENFPAY